jgi:hypothetical protein
VDTGSKKLVEMEEEKILVNEISMGLHISLFVERTEK